jgi:spore coat polysaccharide biosynthesis protein SpsF
MSVIASIQARTGSTRLPGKVLKQIAGQPMLMWQVNRILKSGLIDKLVVATSVNPNDDVIADFCKANEIACYRGSEDDVLARISGLLQEYDYDYHAEFYGDSPLISVEIIDAIIGKFMEGQGLYDCVCNSLATTYPPGQEVIIYRSELLVQADNKVETTDPLREHCGIHVTKNPELKVLNLEAPPEYFFPEMYLEVDTDRDFVVINRIIEHFMAAGNPDFTLRDIIDFFSINPELASYNQAETRHWKSFRE